MHNYTYYKETAIHVNKMRPETAFLKPYSIYWGLNSETHNMSLPLLCFLLSHSLSSPPSYIIACIILILLNKNYKRSSY